MDRIIRRLRDQGEAVGTATVYRTLDVLVESGLVRAHDFGEGFKRYEPMSAQAHHEHLICERCGRVVEFQNERLERMLPVIADEHAFQHSRHRVEIYGVCRDCRRRELVVPCGGGMNEPAALGIVVAFAAGLSAFSRPACCRWFHPTSAS